MMVSILSCQALPNDKSFKVATNVENANRGYLQSLENIGVSLKSIDDGTKNGLNNIGSNVQDNKDSQESIINGIATSIRQFTSESNDLNQQLADNLANLDKNGKASMSELRSTLQPFDSLSEISISNLNKIAENIKNMDRNTEGLMDSFKTNLVNAVVSLGSTNKDGLVKIAQNLDNAGGGYLNSLNSIISNIKLLDEHSYATLTGIAKNMETEGLSSQAILSNILKVAENIKGMDINNKDSLDSIKTILQTSITNAATNNKDSLVDIATKVGGVGDGFLDNLKHIADNIKQFDQNSLASLSSISKNIETNGINSQESASRISDNINGNSLSLDKVVTELKTLDASNQQSIASLKAGLESSLGVMSGSNKDVLTRLSQNVAASGSQYLNQLKAIADNIMSFDEHQQSSGNQYGDDLKKLLILSLRWTPTVSHPLLKFSRL